MNPLISCTFRSLTRCRAPENLSLIHIFVVSDKQDKTVVVRVDRRFTHATMKKTIRRSKKYHAHDEKNEFSVGDTVWIEERRPISKLKCWEVIRGDKKQKA